MNLFILLLSIFLTVISTATLVYISIATMIGPWIAPTLVLFSSGFLALAMRGTSRVRVNQYLAIIQSVAAGGGALGIGIGFTFPMLYFLDQALFQELLADPFVFSLKFGFSCLAAGGLGITLGSLFTNNLVMVQELPFPASSITYNVIKSSSNIQHAWNLFLGCLTACLIYILQHGFFVIPAFLPFAITLVPPSYAQGIVLALSPLSWSLGFTAGLKIAFPLLVGALSKMLFVFLLHERNAWVIAYSSYRPTAENILTGFCTGLILSEIIMGLLPSLMIFLQRIGSLPSWWRQVTGELINWQRAFRFYERLKGLCHNLVPHSFELACVLGMSVIMLSFLGFSLPMQFVLLASTTIATYYICLIGGEIGMIQFGRFSTFVIIIMMALFNLNALQITTVGLFFSLCAATSSDLLFDYKIFQLAHMPTDKVKLHQWLGLVVASLSVGMILWLVFSHYELGSAELFAQRGKTKALLVQALHFEPFILICGFIYGVLLKKLRISPTMTLGGLLMPNKLISGLVAGALLTRIFRNKEKSLPFAAGVFTTETVLMIVPIIITKFF